LKKPIWNAFVLSLIPIFTSACNNDEKSASAGTGTYSASAPATGGQNTIVPAQASQNTAAPSQAIQTTAAPAQIIQTTAAPAQIIQTTAAPAQVSQNAAAPAQVSQNTAAPASNQAKPVVEPSGGAYATISPASPVPNIAQPPAGGGEPKPDKVDARKADAGTDEEHAVDPADVRAAKLVAQMSLDEKLQFIHTDHKTMGDTGGGGAGHIPGLPRLNIPELTIADSSSGSGALRLASTTFPATLAVAASWDEKLSYDYGVEIAKQLRAQGYGMGLGGGANMVRDPRSGRIFEYLGEDPFLAGKLLAWRTKGTQSQQVIATIKHIVGNEQEAYRATGSSTIDERTLREIYMLPFEIAVREAEPGSVMCAYNKLTLDKYPADIFACQHYHTLTEVLKNEWGFKGQVQTDWQAIHSTADAINAGVDEEEDWQAATFFLPANVKPLLNDGTISISRLDDMVRRKLRTMIKVGVMDNPPVDNKVADFKPKIDFDSGAAVAQRVAEESIVLLKNREPQAPLSAAPNAHLLPLNAVNLRKIAVIGAHADDAVLSGGGSGSTRHPVGGSYGTCGKVKLHRDGSCGWWAIPWTRVRTSILQAIKDIVPDADVNYGGNSDRDQPFRPYTAQEIDDAVNLASTSDVAIVVVAQPSGEDVTSLSLSLSVVHDDKDNPSNQDELVTRVAAVNKNTIVIIESGNPILMPWIDNVAAVLETWYPGENGGPAIANILFGKINPSGKLPITFPKMEIDTPTGGGAWSENPVYSEKLEVGYRWYDAKSVTPSFEFGFGLSYTSFSYSELRVDTDGTDGTKTVSFSVENTGMVSGKEVPQVYIQFPSAAGEPPKRLVGWEKVDLKPGEKKK